VATCVATCGQCESTITGENLSLVYRTASRRPWLFWTDEDVLCRLSLHLLHGLPLTVCCSSKSRLAITFLVLPSGTCSPGWSRTYYRRAVKRLCVCVCIYFPGCLLVRNCAVFSLHQQSRQTPRQAALQPMQEFRRMAVLHADLIELLPEGWNSRNQTGFQSWIR